MSSLNLTSLEYITRESLASSIKDSPSEALPDDTAIIDVRDSDHIGGHIKGSTWVPSSQLDYRTPDLIRTLKDKKVVVFHCALSQQRGPSAALRYLREKERLDGGVKQGKVEATTGGKAGVEAGETKEEGRGEGNNEEQKVYVLKGGFTEWQEKYGEDQKLTEGYQKDIWEFGN
ncbi:Rhodanese-like protein [Plenodomus tracheiphilus IPT5]|uniref:Rhodanese-like protein n=1 Tax=Plenodomus tracheiphilus IPT5 TaxID=1408161 RepID=A0A6A7B7W7_9PLEO|nr:Rhodanese-like protein [Plenodomus tracheiphilus IPT5]